MSKDTNSKEFDTGTNNRDNEKRATNQQIDSRCATGLKESKEKKTEGICTAKR